MDLDIEEQTRSKSNIILSNFCQACQFTKKMKFPKAQSDQQSVFYSYSDLVFMAPERLTGAVNIDQSELQKRADMWSMGVLAYLLISGSLPFKGATCQELFDRIKKAEI